MASYKIKNVDGRANASSLMASATVTQAAVDVMGLSYNSTDAAIPFWTIRLLHVLWQCPRRESMKMNTTRHISMKLANLYLNEARRVIRAPRHEMLTWAIIMDLMKIEVDLRLRVRRHLMDEGKLTHEVM